MDLEITILGRSNSNISYSAVLITALISLYSSSCSLGNSDTVVIIPGDNQISKLTFSSQDSTDCFRAKNPMSHSALLELQDSLFLEYSISGGGLDVLIDLYSDISTIQSKSKCVYISSGGMRNLYRPFCFADLYHCAIINPSTDSRVKDILDKMVLTNDIGANNISNLFEIFLEIEGDKLQLYELIVLYFIWLELSVTCYE